MPKPSNSPRLSTIDDTPVPYPDVTDTSHATRALPVVPYGVGASLAHVVGGRLGGGYEWFASPSAAPMRRGNAAVELDVDGKVSRFTVVYDSGLLSYPTYQSLVMLAAEAAA